MAPTPVFSPGKSPPQRNLSMDKGYSPWGLKKSWIHLATEATHTTVPKQDNTLSTEVSGKTKRLIFPSQGLNPGLLDCRKILYHLSHKGGIGILEQVAYPFSRGTS